MPPEDPAQQARAEQARQAAAGAVMAGAAAQTGGAAATPGVAAFAAVPVIPVAAGALTTAATVKLIKQAFSGFQVRRSDDIFDMLAALMLERYPDRPQGERLATIDEEQRREVVFRMRSLDRLEKGLRKALQEPDEVKRQAAVERVLRAEERYTLAREEAVVERAIASQERNLLRELSPSGAFWALSPFVVQHTPDCVAMSGKWWSWAVLDKVHPPLHHGCPCALFGLDEARERGLVPREFTPSDSDAMHLLRARGLLKDYPELRDQLSEALQEASYREAEHPRDRLGRWRKMVRGFGSKMPVQYDQNLRPEATQKYVRHEGETVQGIVVGPKFEKLSENQQKGILAHEIGHRVSDAMLVDPEADWLWDVENWRDGEGVVLGSEATTPGERLADAAASVLLGNQSDIERWPAVRRVGEYMERHGLVARAAPPVAHPGEWDRADFMKRWRELPDDADVWVYHATAPETGEAMLASGIDPEGKPRTLARERYEAGEYAEYQPGSGVGGGLYVGAEPMAVSGYGRTLLAVKVPKRSIEASPEQVALGANETWPDPIEAGGQSLRVGDAMVAATVPPENVREVPVRHNEQGQRLTPTLEDALAVLREASYEEQLHPRNRLGRWVRKLGFPAFEVGGAVRDDMLGKTPKDIDYMLMASPERIKAAVEAAGHTAEDLIVRDRLVGVRAYGPELPPEGVELTPPRVEVSTGPEPTDFEIRPHPEVIPSQVPDDQRAYIAEDAMKRGGFLGRPWHIPVGKMEDGRALGSYGPKAQEASQFASEAAGFPVTVVATTYWPEEKERGDIVHASADRMQRRISVKPDTDDLTILHEVGHLVADEPGHGENWVRATQDLYRRYLGDEAAKVFGDLLLPNAERAIADDSNRRDFALNALYRDVDTGALVDPTGEGISDAERRLLRTTSPDSFRDDPLRIMRGLRFISQHNLELHPETREQMIEHADAVASLTTSKGGVTGTAEVELNKLLMGDHPAKALRVARDTGVLQTLLPELGPMIGFDQESKYHQFTVDEHVFSTLEQAARMNAPLEVRLALLFHDSGKPESAWRGDKDDRLHYYANEELGKEDHAIVGARIADEALARLNYPGATRKRVRTLIENHMLQPGKVAVGRLHGDVKSERRRAKRIRQLRSRLGDDTVDMLLMHRRADMGGKGEDSDGAEQAMQVMDDFMAEVEASRQRGDPTNLKDLAVRGNQLIEWGVPPGPMVGELLGEVLDQVLADPSLNTEDWIHRHVARRLKKLVPEPEPLVKPKFAAKVRRLRSEPGQGTMMTRTTTPVEGQTGQRDALAIQAAEVGIPPEHYDQWTEERLRKLMSPEAEVAVRLYPNRMERFAREGHLLSGSKVERHADDDRSESYYDERRAWELDVWGDHPIYGYMAERDEHITKAGPSGFGSVKLSLKPGVRDRTTFIYSDSNYVGVGEGGALPSPVNEPDPASVPYFANLGGVEKLTYGRHDQPLPEPPDEQMPEHLQQMKRTIERGFGDEMHYNSLRRQWLDDVGYNAWRHGDFFEAQIHGDITTEDVARIEFSEPPSDYVADRLRALGIKWEVFHDLNVEEADFDDRFHPRDRLGRWRDSPRLKGPWGGQAAEEVNQTVGELLDRYPDVPLRHVEVGDWVDDINQYAGKSHDTIHVSPKFLDDENAAEREREWRGLSKAGEFGRPGTIVHEFGHILDGLLLRNHRDVYDELDEFFNEEIPGIDEKPTPRIQLGLEAPSPYGAENRFEFFAEGFTDWYFNGEQAHPSSRFIGQLVERVFAHPVEEAFDPDQPRYPKGHPKAGQWRPKIASGRGRIGPKGMKNDIFYLNQRIKATQNLYSGWAGVPEGSLVEIGQEVEKLAKRYSTRRAYEERRGELRAERTELQNIHHDAYDVAMRKWRAEGKPPNIPEPDIPVEVKTRLRELGEEEVRLVRAGIRADRDALVGMLAQIRPMGGRKLALDDKSPFVVQIGGDIEGVVEQYGTYAAAQEDARAALDEAAKLLPRDWLDESNAKGSIKFNLVGQGRASHQLAEGGNAEQYAEMDAKVDELLDQGWTWIGTAEPWSIVESPEGKRFWINWGGAVMDAGEVQGGPPELRKPPVERVVPGPRPERTTTLDSVLSVNPAKRDVVLHEVAHRMEVVLGEVLKNGYRSMNNRTIGFLYRRTRNEPATPLAELVPESGYRDDEVSTPDGFFDPYVGKRYGGRTFGDWGHTPTEVLTMGLQYLYYPVFGRDLDSDPEHRAFMLGTLAAV